MLQEVKIVDVIFTDMDTPRNWQSICESASTVAVHWWDRCWSAGSRRFRPSDPRAAALTAAAASAGFVSAKPGLATSCTFPAVPGVYDGRIRRLSTCRGFPRPPQGSTPAAPVVDYRLRHKCRQNRRAWDVSIGMREAV